MRQSGIRKCVFVNSPRLWSARLKDFMASWFLMNVLWWFKIIWIMDISGGHSHKTCWKENVPRWLVSRLPCFYLCCCVNYSSRSQWAYQSACRFTVHTHTHNDFDFSLLLFLYLSPSTSLQHFNYTLDTHFFDSTSCFWHFLSLSISSPSPTQT